MIGVDIIFCHVKREFQLSSIYNHDKLNVQSKIISAAHTYLHGSFLFKDIAGWLHVTDCLDKLYLR